MHLYISTRSTRTHRDVCDLHKAYGLIPPPEPQDAVIVCDGEGTLVAATYLYQAGPFLFADFAIGNPNAPLRAMHQAAEIIVEQWFLISASRGLIPQAAVRNSPGLVMMLGRLGFRVLGTTMTAPPFVRLTRNRPQETATHQIVGPPTPAPEGPAVEGPESGQPMASPTIRKKAKRRKVGKKKVAK